MTSSGTTSSGKDKNNRVEGNSMGKPFADGQNCVVSGLKYGVCGRFLTQCFCVSTCARACNKRCWGATHKISFRGNRKPQVLFPGSVLPDTTIMVAAGVIVSVPVAVGEYDSVGVIIVIPVTVGVYKWPVFLLLGLLGMR